MRAYYNEHDAFAAAWLRNLIADGLIADGDVDDRDIQKVQGSDLDGYTQVHLFAGIGGWSYALRLAGWPDDRPVWTGSCPCQPFSSAGKRQGEADARHLWPEMRRLISERTPPVCFGEQVASDDGCQWLAGVFADLEELEYRVAGADLCAAGEGAPHIRQRLFWVADSGRCRNELRARPGGESGAAGSVEGEAQEWEWCGVDTGGSGSTGRMGNPGHDAIPERARGSRRQARQRLAERAIATGAGEDRGMVNADEAGRREHRGPVSVGSQLVAAQRASGLGAWHPLAVVKCGDGKWRRVEPSTFPLADGVPNRVGTLCGAGNAIVPQVAARFIEAYMTI